MKAIDALMALGVVVLVTMLGALFALNAHRVTDHICNRLFG